MLRELFENTVYIRVRVNSFRVRHIERKKEIELVARKPFSHERMLVGNFVNAVDTLKEGMKRLFERSLFQPSPFVVIQPLERTEGGLAEVEERALKEMALSIGARNVLVWVGAELADAEVIEMLRSVR